jgi:hypothetical protein
LTIIAPDNIPLLLVASPIAITVVTTIIGIWLATSPDPPQKGIERFASLRRLARWSICVGLAGCFITIVTLSINSDWMPVAGGIFVLLGLFGVVAALAHVRKIALRIRHRKLSLLTRISTWLFILNISPWLTYALVSFVYWELLEASPLEYRLLGMGITLWACFDSITRALEPILDITLAILPGLSLIFVPLIWWYRRRFLDAVAIRKRSGASASL